jgi:hypothetical protein
MYKNLYLCWSKHKEGIKITAIEDMLKKHRFRKSIVFRNMRKKQIKYRFGKLTRGQFDILHFLLGKTPKDKAEDKKLTSPYKIYHAMRRHRRKHFGREEPEFSSSTFYENFRYLKKYKLVNEANVLTLKGLILATDLDFGFDRIDDVAKNQPELLPLIFTNWSRFDKFGVREDVINILRRSFDYIRQQPTTQLIEEIYVTGEPLLKLSEEELRLDVMKFIFRNLLITVPPEKREAWIKVISCRPELCKFARSIWEGELVLSKLGIVGLEDDLEAINRKDPEILKYPNSKHDKLMKELKTKVRALPILLAKLEKESMNRLVARKSAR